MLRIWICALFIGAVVMIGCEGTDEPSKSPDGTGGAGEAGGITPNPDGTCAEGYELREKADGAQWCYKSTGAGGAGGSGGLTDYDGDGYFSDVDCDDYNWQLNKKLPDGTCDYCVLCYRGQVCSEQECICAPIENDWIREGQKVDCRGTGTCYLIRNRGDDDPDDSLRWCDPNGCNWGCTTRQGDITRRPFTNSDEADILLVCTPIE